jgi:citrate lyase subunit beta/citryl-CoA lyase
MTVLLRSCLFVPGNNYRAILKTERINADALIFDLEDAVPFEEKETARIFVRDALKRLNLGRRLKIVRINAEEGLMEEDLKAVLVGGLDGIMLPKVEGKEDVLKLRNRIKDSGLNPLIIALIESARGVIKADEVAESVTALAFGALDYYRTLGRNYFKFSAEQVELLYARAAIVNAAKAYGKKAIDSPFFGLIIDREGLEWEARAAWQLGFDGKLVIHPNHVEIVNEIFSPSEEDVRLAKEIVERFEMGDRTVRGRMIDYASYAQAKDILGMHEEIVGRDENG